MKYKSSEVSGVLASLVLSVACGNGSPQADAMSTGGVIPSQGGASKSSNPPSSGGTLSATAAQGGTTGIVLAGGTAGTNRVLGAGGSPLGVGGTTALSLGGTTSQGGTTALSFGGTTSKGGTTTLGGTTAAGGTTSKGGTTTLGGSTAAGGTTVKPAVAYPYVFSVFNDSAAVSSLQIYTSNDALNFTLLTDTGYTGPTGNLRDPSILLHTDGKFYVAFTTPPAGTGCCGAQSSFSIAASSDLRKWTTVVTVPSGIAGVTNVWAPEWYKDSDGSLHILVSVDQKTYRYEPTDATLTKFGAGTFIGIGPGYIDTFIVKTAGTYHAFAKKEASKFIEHATASNLDGPWSFVGVGDWAGWGTHREAQDLLQLDNGTWRLYCDGGSAGHEMYSDSADGFKTWTAIKGLPAVGNNISHGTVIRGM